MQRKLILLIVFFCWTSVGVGQQIVQRFYDYVGPSSLIKSNSGSIYMSGIINNPPSLNYQAFLSKIDSIGKPLWTIGYFDSTNVCLFNLRKSKQMIGGDFIHSIVVVDSANNYYQMFLKTDSTGNVTNARRFVFPQVSNIVDFVEDNDGNIVFAGQIDYGFVSFYQDYRYLLFKTDAALNLIWSKEYKAFVDEHFRSIDVFADGSYLLQGEYLDTTDYFGNPNEYGRIDVCVLKTDTNGDIVWAKLTGNPLFPNPLGSPDAISYPCKAIVADDGTVINGFSCDWYANLSSGGKADIMIQRLDTNGNEIACHRYGDQTYGYERLKDIYEDSNQNILFSNQHLLFKSSYTLNKEWIRYCRPSLVNANSFVGFFDFKEIGQSVYQALALTQIGSPYKAAGCFISTDSLGTSGCNNQSVGFFFDQSETPGTFDITNRFTENTIVGASANINVSSSQITLTDSVSCNTSTEINNYFNEIHLLVYPNPTTENIYIQGLTETCRYRVTSLESEILKEGLVGNDDDIKVSLKGLKAGFYFLTIELKSHRLNYKILKI